MKAATNQLSIVEKAAIAVCGFFWRSLLLLNPKPLQRYFAARVNVDGLKVNRIYKLDVEDSKNHVCRINNNRMKDGEGHLAKRGELIKVFNPANGQFVLRYAQGAGDLRLRFTEIGLDYDAKVALGVLNEDECDLVVMKANAADREFYLMYQDRSDSSRQSRALGWFILLGGLLLTIVSAVIQQLFSMVAYFF